VEKYCRVVEEYKNQLDATCYSLFYFL